MYNNLARHQGAPLTLTAGIFVLGEEKLPSIPDQREGLLLTDPCLIFIRELLAQIGAALQNTPDAIDHFLDVIL